MISKHLRYNRPFLGPAADGVRQLEEDGHFLARAVFSPEQVARLRAEVDAVFRDFAPDWRPGSPTLADAAKYRYEMFNRSAACQAAIGERGILDRLEPLLGDDCHAISCTAWRNPPGRDDSPDGMQWHVDGGPYIARPEGQEWPEHIAYPIFVITTQIYLQDVALDDGPTAVLPGSYKSGRLPPHEERWDLDLRYGGRGGEVHVAEAGDVTFFVSDSWHRRMPTTEACRGRYFLQTAFGRREIAQRLRLPEHHHCVGEAALARATTERAREILGIHPPGFYDS
jgi:hypothetical protein